MPTALDTFRAQREAADGVYARLIEVSQLLHQLRGQADALARNDELQAVLQREQSWLDQARRTIEEARRWRELEMRRFWPGVWRRWALALIFALASAAAAGAGYARIEQPYAAEITALRSRMNFAEFIEHRVVTMTPAERRQFDTLMKWDAPTKR
jgi:predicted metal-dependent hydrolase